MAESTITREMIEAAAAAIANARAGRKGAPPTRNVLEMLEQVAPEILVEVVEDAEAALEAALGSGGDR
ncbi:hypothetical protein [Methylobacterium sp. J-070]|uniref:hypothetical protein n=1 Tax=Methylobacterium sp. J-070 TaxID=2836650 RepID=UPI001FBB9B4B|nr:hypothetical protein [Methylobacterium sp. J-070]MCJ2051663.1 hypothetical protein [Methylobacterium sp. J-070]